MSVPTDPTVVTVDGLVQFVVKEKSTALTYESNNQLPMNSQEVNFIFLCSELLFIFYYFQITSLLLMVRIVFDLVNAKYNPQIFHVVQPNVYYYRKRLAKTIFFLNSRCASHESNFRFGLPSSSYN